MDCLAFGSVEDFSELSNFLVAEAASDKLEDFDFAVGKRVCTWRRPFFDLCYLI